LPFQVCIDDSWDGLKEKAVVAGGFIGFSKQWTDLKTTWMRRLRLLLRALMRRIFLKMIGRAPDP
jgi:hypothetical protein